MLLAYARKGDTLAIVRLDRLGRSLAELLAIVEQLKVCGVALLSLEEKIDTSSAAGELIAERTKDGIAAARARGKVPGRQPVDLDKRPRSGRNEGRFGGAQTWGRTSS